MPKENRCAVSHGINLRIPSVDLTSIILRKLAHTVVRVEEAN
jgi:hypothetical protein